MLRCGIPWSPEAEPIQCPWSQMGQMWEEIPREVRGWGWCWGGRNGDLLAWAPAFLTSSSEKLLGSDRCGVAPEACSQSLRPVSLLCRLPGLPEARSEQKCPRGALEARGLCAHCPLPPAGGIGWLLNSRELRGAREQCESPGLSPSILCTRLFLSFLLLSLL